MGGLCPNCKEAFCEIVDHDRTETGRLVHVFECPSCETRWTYSLGS